jgi:L-rhamnose mutarotase
MTMLRKQTNRGGRKPAALRKSERRSGKLGQRKQKDARRHLAESAAEPHGSLIRLRPEFEERYVILHKHTFPGVLERIRKCGIRNYSIFLLDGTLFSHFEYVGKNFRSDMAAMGDQVTKEWWKLTEPMQEPVEGCAEGEWWASMESVLFFRKPDAAKGRVRRLAGVARFPLAAGSGEQIRARVAEIESRFRRHPMVALALYRWGEKVYCYCEVHGRLELGDLFEEMREVFHFA